MGLGLIGVLVLALVVGGARPTAVHRRPGHGAQLDDTEITITVDDGSFDVVVPGLTLTSFAAPAEAGAYAFTSRRSASFADVLVVDRTGMSPRAVARPLLVRGPVHRRSAAREGTVMGELAYGESLRSAWELGAADGHVAAAFESPGPDAGRSGVCHGRSPAEFARLLWHGRRGMPPVGLVVNAPLWYAAGFADGLATGTARVRPLPGPARSR